ncbi:hypothetical protein ES708_32504 [subsurface metagenome]
MIGKLIKTSQLEVYDATSGDKIVPLIGHDNFLAPFFCLVIIVGKKFPLVMLLNKSEPKVKPEHVGWLEVNGEAIYDTTPWMIYGEGPTQLIKAGMFSEKQEVKYTKDDIRFTVKDDNLYAICLGWPGGEVIIKSIAEKLYKSEINSVKMLGVDEELPWAMTKEGFTIKVPAVKPCKHAYVFKIKRNY